MKPRLTPLALIWTVIIGSLVQFTAGPSLLALSLAFLELTALTYSLNLITGLTGYVNFGHIAFYGVGAYGTAILVSQLHGLGLSPYIYALPGGLVAAALAYVLGRPVLRLRGAYFAVLTLGLSEAIRIVMTNIPQLGGSEGIPLAAIIRYELPTAHFAMFTTFVAIAAGTFFIHRSKTGLMLRAIREDEDAAEALGVDTTEMKLRAFVLAAFFAGVVGGVAGVVNVYVYPAGYFSIGRNVEMIVAMMLGGYGTVLGPLIGSLAFFSIKDFLLVRYPYLHLVIFGAMIMVLALVFPRGIMGVLQRRQGLKGLLE